MYSNVFTIKKLPAISEIYSNRFTITKTEGNVSVDGVYLNKTLLYLKVDEEYVLKETVIPTIATNKSVTWESSDVNIVTVNNGNIKAIKKGSSVITVTTVDGSFKDTCLVHVLDNTDEHRIVLARGQFTISDLQDGEVSTNCMLTSESVVISASHNGTINSGQIGYPECNASTMVLAKKGNVDLIPCSNSDTLKEGYYKVEIESSINCTSKKYNNNQIYIDTVNTKFSSGKVVIKVYLEKLDNVVVKEYTYTIVKDGALSKDIKINGPMQIHYDKYNTPNISDITLKAIQSNYNMPILKWYYQTNTGYTLIDNVTDTLSFKHDSNYFYDNMACIKVSCIESDGKDEKSYEHIISKSFDGSDTSDLKVEIEEGTRSIHYKGNGSLATTSIKPFKLKVYSNSLDVTSSPNVKSITWKSSGHYSDQTVSNGNISFTPTPISIYDESKLDTIVSVVVNYDGKILKASVPILVVKNSTALDWVEEWDGSKTEIGDEQIITPRLFAGKKDNQKNTITGIALGQDIINKNSNIGMAVYYDNKLIGRINADPSVDNGKLISFGDKPGSQFILHSDGRVIIEGGTSVKISASETTTVDDIYTITKKAEQDTKPDSIKDTVSSFVDSDGKPTFVKTTIMEQTLEGFEYRISESGHNLLYNSSFANNRYDKWTFVNGAEYFGVLSYYKDKGDMFIKNTQAKSGHLGHNESIKINPEKKYTISLSATKESNVKGGNVYLDCYSNIGEFIRTKRSELIFDNKRHNYTFEFENDVDYIRFYIEHNGVQNTSAYNYLLKINKPCLCEGEIAIWTPHSSEVYDGITSIDKDGIKVSMSNGEGLQGYSAIDYEGLSVCNSDGVRKAWFGQDDSAFVDVLKANWLDARNMTKKYVDNVQLYVSTIATGDGSGRDAANRCGGIRRAFQILKDRYGEYVHGNVEIHVENGNYYEDIYIEGFLGAGGVTLNLAIGVVVYGRIVVDNMGKNLIIKGNKTDTNTNNGAQLILDSTDNNQSHIYVRNSSVEINGIRAYNRKANKYHSRFVSGEYGSKILLNFSDISRYYYGMFIQKSCVGCITQCRGFTYYAGVTRYGSHLSLNNYPKGVENSWGDYGGEIHTSGNPYDSIYDPNYGTVTPPPPPPENWQWVEKEFVLTGLFSNGNGARDRSGVIGQGQWGTGKGHIGTADIPASIVSFCSGGRGVTMKCRMHRQSGAHGQSGAIPKPRILQGNGSYWQTSQAFALNATHTFSLPSTVYDYIKTGSMTKLQIHATTNNDYSFYDSAIIIVRCEKNMA